jgi:hypothetical protein
MNQFSVAGIADAALVNVAFDRGLDHWRHFDPWLGPLKAALGATLESYPVGGP